MALQLTVTNPSNGAVYNNAYGRIDDWLLTGPAANPLTTNTILNWYFSRTTANAANPALSAVRADGSVGISTSLLNNPNPTFVAALGAACQSGAIVSPLDALKTSLYLLLLQLPQYAGAVTA